MSYLSPLSRRPDQSEEELVESVLQLVSLPKTEVRTAVRLPLRSRGRSIVLVEMDSQEERSEVIQHKDDFKKATLFR